MSSRPLIGMLLLFLSAVTSGCGTSADKNAAAVQEAARIKGHHDRDVADSLALKADDEKRAAEKRAAENDYRKMLDKKIIALTDSLNKKSKPERDEAVEALVLLR